MDTLVRLLKAQEMNPDIAQDNGYFNQNTPEMRAIVSLATELLIDDQGQCNWDNIDILQEEGFYVFPGERDRFGWLTGCISMMNGTIVYG